MVDIPAVIVEPIPEQHLPETSSDDPMHVLDETCWCKPVVETEPARIRHRNKEGVPALHQVVEENDVPRT